MYYVQIPDVPVHGDTLLRIARVLHEHGLGKLREIKEMLLPLKNHQPVSLGPFEDRTSAEEMLEALRNKGNAVVKLIEEEK
ncbi:MAG: hypothetical protein IMW91_09880 [Firmicutes bacterium]|nr:hypothetical protein [Bacillota bacterium]